MQSPKGWLFKGAGMSVVAPMDQWYLDYDQVEECLCVLSYSDACFL